jgi:hypothetical protein
MLQSNIPTPSETYNFLSGHGISIGAGYIGGVNWTISPVNNATVNALGVGLYTPQIEASYNFTPDNVIFNKEYKMNNFIILLLFSAFLFFLGYNATFNTLRALLKTN